MYRKSASTWRWPLALLAAYVALWAALAIDPRIREAWLLENFMVFVAVPLLALTARQFRFSNFVYACLFVFFAFHAVGAHYTYALVPYADWWRSLGGGALEGRNDYDRLGHFLYGLLVTPAVVEFIARYGRFPRPLAILIPWLVMAGQAMVWELLEYAAAVFFGGGLGPAYLGMQGDVWDAQNDMALSLAGTTVMLATLAAAGRLPRRRKGDALSKGDAPL